jgi:hypothetical protein
MRLTVLCCPLVILGIRGQISTILIHHSLLIISHYNRNLRDLRRSQNQGKQKQKSKKQQQKATKNQNQNRQKRTQKKVDQISNSNNNSNNNSTSKKPFGSDDHPHTRRDHLLSIEKEIQAQWEQQKAFQVAPNPEQEKYFVTLFSIYYYISTQTNFFLLFFSRNFLKNQNTKHKKKTFLYLCLFVIITITNHNYKTKKVRILT